jgi:hypothetical protein
VPSTSGALQTVAVVGARTPSSPIGTCPPVFGARERLRADRLLFGKRAISGEVSHRPHPHDADEQSCDAPMLHEAWPRPHDRTPPRVATSDNSHWIAPGSAKCGLLGPYQSSPPIITRRLRVGSICIDDSRLQVSIDRLYPNTGLVNSILAARSPKRSTESPNIPVINTGFSIYAPNGGRANPDRLAASATTFVRGLSLGRAHGNWRQTHLRSGRGRRIRRRIRRNGRPRTFVSEAVVIRAHVARSAVRKRRHWRARLLAPFVRICVVLAYLGQSTAEILLRPSASRGSGRYGRDA